MPMHPEGNGSSLSFESRGDICALHLGFEDCIFGVLPTRRDIELPVSGSEEFLLGLMLSGETTAIVQQARAPVWRYAQRRQSMRTEYLARSWISFGNKLGFGKTLEQPGRDSEHCAGAHWNREDQRARHRPVEYPTQNRQQYTDGLEFKVKQPSGNTR
ncbi:uncharacterized protein CIMG_00452 [Coccidioides immitis RS]|uniref:Uncharacterized protein n=1 Tax=Coccidioides immitis (strain RS) TaxID=246410 RepID=A0A0E1RZV0_COCIM|nr:uncharacterized protein CIMG_00452 [Coccidioides immitis RS]EAS35098.2 hypothetical protein CIMG_00452 [Coccidioides immitis RS]